MIDAAIVGLGRWGRSFVEAGSAGLRFTRAVETALDGAQGFAARHGLVLGDSLDEVLADPAIGAVVLATPHSLHPAQVLACAAARKPVFCEKPLALRLGDARSMVEACRVAGVPLAVGHNRRFWPSMRALRRLVADGALGQVLHVEGHNSNENAGAVKEGWRLSPAESPGGGMTGAGLHVLDAFVSLMGPVRRVQARLLSHKPAPSPLDTVSVLVEFANGTSGMLATVRDTPFYWRVHVFGSRGSAEVLGETRLVLHRSGAAPEVIPLDPADSLRAELDAFATTVADGTPYPIPPSDMLATVAAFEAVISSIEKDIPCLCDVP